jgi:hypothetical protein
MSQRFDDTCCRLVTAHQETSSDNFLRDFGERFVPAYKPVSTVDLLMDVRRRRSSQLAKAVALLGRPLRDLARGRQRAGARPRS